MIDAGKINYEMNAILKDIDSKVKNVQLHLTQNMKPIKNFTKEDNIPGVYAFFIKPKVPISIYEFEDAWINEDIIKYPKVVRSRFDASIATIKKFYTFYIGKSEKVSTRINEHITHTSKITTYGLKLNDRLDFLNDYELFFSKFEMEELVGLDPSIIQFVITRIESKLRGIMNPWIGKQ